MSIGERIPKRKIWWSKFGAILILNSFTGLLVKFEK